ncbi:hypothetical protein DL767_008935 [Monosporascus sp. MG133]|nr:hypothetical protein DL767_008935 [Monosporascus sp. MG133]
MASILDGQHERGDFRVGSGRFRKTGIGLRQGKAEDERVGDAEEGDSEKNLFRGKGVWLSGTPGLGGGQTNELGAAERERNDDEKHRRTR